MTEDNFLDFATTDLIINNTYRLLGLSAHASLRDIIRKQKFLTLSENLQILQVNRSDGYQEALREAVISVQDPVQRLLHRIFWIWSEDETSLYDSSKDLIPLDYFQTAITYWEGKINSGQSSIIAMHNLAVIYQAVFLESCQTGHKFSSAAEASGEIETYCEKSLHYWEKVASSRNFWQKIFEWAASENDPRLSREFLQYLKSQFLPFLITIFIDSAWDILITGNETKSLEIINHLKKTSFAQKYQTQAFDYSFRWVEGKVRALIRDSKVQVGSQKPAMLYSLIHQSIARMQVLQNFAQALAYEDPQKSTRLKDAAAMHFLEPVEDMRNKSEYLFVSMKLMEDITDFPVSLHLIKKADDLHKMLVEEQSSGNYWYTEDYFELRDSLVDSLENARTLFKLQDFTGAVAALETIFVDQFAKGALEAAAVDQALSVVLNAQGMEWLDESYAEMNKPRPLIENLRRKGSMGMNYRTNCANCASSLYGSYYNMQVDGISHQICQNCGDEDKWQVMETRTKVRHLFSRIRTNLTRAIKLNPKNNVVKKNLDLIYEIANKLNISFITSEATDSRTSQTRTEVKRKKDNSCLNWAIIIIAIFLVILCYSSTGR